MPVRVVLNACAVALLAVTALALVPSAGAAASSALSRAPYLTDATATSVRVSWATPAGGSANAVSWGPAGSDCGRYSATGTSSPFTVVSTAETMWSARIGNLAPDTNYCYQILSAGAPVLGA